MEFLGGLILFLVGFFTLASIASVSTLGLNICWGVTGLFNIGIAGFYAVGAYTSAILTAEPSVPSNPHLGGFELPVPVGWAGAMVLSAVIAWGVGKICLRLRADYLAIATIGIAEIIRIIFRNWGGLAGGSYGIHRIPRPFEDLAQPWSEIGYLLVVVAVVAVCYWVIERGINSPWGRVMRAIRENETAAAAAGKDVEKMRLQAFVYGSALMGLAGALSAHYLKQFLPEDTEPLTATFLIWVMLIAGGSGNNKGAILGAFVVWGLWTMSEFITDLLSAEWATRAGYIRVFLIGFLLQIVLQFYSRGIIPEKPPVVPRGEANAGKVEAG
jgi:branched-chain amino acid transport system permease protein